MDIHEKMADELLSEIETVNGSLMPGMRPGTVTLIKEALRRVAEQQREADAKIADKHYETCEERQNNAKSKEYVAVYSSRKAEAFDIAAAIREEGKK